MRVRTLLGLAVATLVVATATRAAAQSPDGSPQSSDLPSETPSPSPSDAGSTPPTAPPSASSSAVPVSQERNEPRMPPPVAPPLRPFGVRVVAEGGFLGVLSNFGVFGQNGTRVDFKETAGQGNLAFYTRWSAELDLGRRHTVVFLYQPLSTEGVHTPTAEERYENVAFGAGVPVRTDFRFPFYRLSYLYELVQGQSGYFALGVSGQIRNADYRFTRLDGTAFAQSSDVGFVPALKVRGELSLGPSAFVGLEADGIYAPISVLNGSTNETVGAILDASLRAGVRLEDRGNAFVVLRYLGGGATNEDPNDYAKNWLHFLFVGLGASLDLFPTPTRVHRRM